MKLEELNAKEFRRIINSITVKGSGNITRNIKRKCEAINKKGRVCGKNASRVIEDEEGEERDVCGLHKNATTFDDRDEEEDEQLDIGTSGEKYVSVDYLQCLLSCKFAYDDSNDNWYMYIFNDKRWERISNQRFRDVAKMVRFNVMESGKKKKVKLCDAIDMFNLFEEYGRVEVIDDESELPGYDRDSDMNVEEMTIENSKPEVLNLFKDIEFKADYVESSEEEVSVIIDHIDRLSGGNSEWVLNWLSHIVQEPEKKNGCSCAFVGPQGCGKSKFAEWLYKYVFGRDNSTKISKASDLFGHFNSHLFKKFGHVEEISDDRGHTDRLKDIITGQDETLNRKFRESRDSEFKLELMFTVNNFRYKLDKNDRRFAVFEWSIKEDDEWVSKPNMNYLESSKYIKDFLESIGVSRRGNKREMMKRAKDMANKFYSYLMDRTITFIPADNIPTTEARINAIEQSKDSVAQYYEDEFEDLYDILRDTDDTTDWYKLNRFHQKFGLVLNKNEELYTKYKRYCDQYKHKAKGIRRFVQDLKVILQENNYTVKEHRPVISGKRRRIQCVKRC